MSDSTISKIWNAELRDVMPTGPGPICACGWCCIVNFTLIILFFPCTVTQLGQFKLGLVRNKVTGYVALDQPHTPGRYWIGFWKEMVEFPSTLNTIEFSEEQPEKGVQHLSVLRSRDKHGKQILLDVSVQYRLRPENIGKIYKDMLTHYEDIFISELRDAFAKAANKFAIAEVWENYTSVTDVMLAKCVEVLTNRRAECWGLQLWGVTLTKQYENKLILTQVRKQAQRTQSARLDKERISAQTKVLVAEYGKNISIVESAGLATKYNMEKEAVSKAQANFIGAQAKQLQLAKDSVCPSKTKSIVKVTGINGSTSESIGNCSDMAWVMNGAQLVKYQKMTLLKALQSSHLVYNMRGGTQPAAVDVEAVRNIQHDRVRRRLLDHGREPQEEMVGSLRAKSSPAKHGPELATGHITGSVASAHEL
jgi:hypothetical protein